MRLSYFKALLCDNLYAKTLNTVKVQHALVGSLNTQIYTHLVDFSSDEYEVQVTDNLQDARKLGEVGFERYDTLGNQHVHRERK
jgi:hypothetical protein